MGVRSLAIAGLTAAVLVVSVPAAGAAVTVLPPANDARHFTASNGGWTSQVTYGTTCVLPGITCALGQASWVASGGVGGSSDGHLRAQVQTTLGVLSDVTIDWTSPSFAAPAVINEATLDVALRPNIANVLALGGAAQLDMLLIDDAAPGTPIVVVDNQALSASTTWTQSAHGAVASGAIVPGHSYRIRLSVHVTAPAGLASSGAVDLDDVELRISDTSGSIGGLGGGSGGGGSTGTGDAGSGGLFGGGGHANPSQLGALLRACWGVDVALTAVEPAGRRVRVRGLSSFASGTAIVIRDERNRVVARTRTGADGRFSASAPRPARARRARARYRATVGRVASVALRLVRTNALRTVRVSGRTVTLSGRLSVRHLGRNVRLQVRGGRGATGCTAGARQLRLVGRARVNRRTGSYTVRVHLPAGSGHLVVRTRALGRIASYSSYAVR